MLERDFEEDEETDDKKKYVTYSSNRQITVCRRHRSLN
jgi:hypothetical protein